MQKNIFHIHTYICKHSTNTVESVVAYALKHGYKKLYFTEHIPMLVKCPLQPRRPSMEELADEKRRIDAFNKKYKNKIKIYFGYEVEYNKVNRWHAKELAKDPYCEFFIFGNHFYGDMFKLTIPLKLAIDVTKTPQQIKEYTDNALAAISSGLFSWVAHPDLFLNSYRKWDKYAQTACKKIIAAAIKYKMPLAFNVNFNTTFKGKDEWHYPCKYFWELVAKTDIPVIIESDSHILKRMTVSWLKQAHKLALSFGLKHNLTENIKLVKLKK